MLYLAGLKNSKTLWKPILLVEVYFFYFWFLNICFFSVSKYLSVLKYICRFCRYRNIFVGLKYINLFKEFVLIYLSVLAYL